MPTDLQTWKLQLALRGITDEPLRAIKQAPPHLIRKWLDALNIRIERERNRGLAKHYRYDLNRHIALADARKIMRLLLADKCKGRTSM